MPDFPTFNDLFRIARDEVLGKAPKLSLEAVERDGSDVNVLVAANAATADEVVGQLADVCAALFLDAAERQALDRLVFDRYNLFRKPAQPALGSVEFRTTAPNPTPFTIPIGITLQTSDGIQFVTTVGSTFPGLSVGPVVVSVRSSLAGADQQAKANTIVNIVGAIPGAPADLVVNNTLATSGADDAESDESLRDRARRFFTTARRGTLAAIEEGALAVPGVRKATAFEVIDTLGRPVRFVQLVVSDAFTDALVQLNQNPVSYQQQSQALAQAVFSGLSDVRAAGMFVQVFVAQVVIQPIILALRFEAGADVDLSALFGRAAIVTKINELKPGDDLVPSEIVKVLETIPGIKFVGDEMISPAGTVVTKALQVIRTSLNLVTATTQSGEPVQLAATANPDFFIIVGQ